MKRWAMSATLLALIAQTGNAQDATGLGYALPPADFVKGPVHVSVSNAEGVWGFCWVEGQVLTYRAEHETTAVEVTADGKAETKTKLNVTKKWLIKEVDPSGVATLQLSLAALRMETTTPGGGALLYDSAAPDKSDEGLRKQLGKLIGVPLATLRVNNLGKVIEVKESKFGPASRFEAEPPFIVVLPSAPVKQKQTWERQYKITQEPPAGAGEKYDAVQTFTLTDTFEESMGRGANLTTLYFSIATAMKTQPESLADRVPLLQMQPEGLIVFDQHNGRMHHAKLTVSKELKGHAGKDSSYRFDSTYTEQYVPERQAGSGK